MSANNTKTLSLFFVLCLFLRMSILGAFPITGTVYYLMLVVFLLTSFFTVTKYGVNHHNKSMLLFLIVSAVSIIANDVMPEFHPWMRYLGFIVVMLTFGPLIQNIALCEIRRQIICYFKYIGALFCSVSLIMKILGISLLMPSAFGLCSYDMTIAPVSFICAILLLNDVASGNRHKKTNFLLFAMCLACGMLTGSRSSMGAFLLALSLYVIWSNKGAKRVKYIGISFLLLFMLFTINPFGLLDHFFEKMDRDSDDVSYVLSGRDEMVVDRIEDFKSSPFYGVGFASMQNITRSKVDFQEGIIESGSSWFLILGSTGLLGLLFCLLSIINSIIVPIKLRENIPLICCIIFTIVHSMVEGYLISFGNPICAIFWLFVSVTQSRQEIFKINEI